MPLIDVSDVQPWLEATKLRLDSDDDLTEEPFQSERVKSRLASCGLDVTTWTDTSSTPTLVRHIIGAYVAAQRYNKAYSETIDNAGNDYANKIEGMADMLIEGICAGTYNLLDATDDPATTGFGSPTFYPDDTVGVIDTEESVRFTMGKVF